MSRRLWVILLLLAVSISTPRAQEALSSKQRIADLEQLVSFYDKNYAPYEWKRDVIGFDLLRLTPWLQRIQHSDDLDYQEALIEYVSSLNDAHDSIAFPTTFFASLGLSVDIYDGKVLIDSINRLALPIAQFPFVIGDELISVDGTPVQTLIESFRKYSIAANQRSTDRIAAIRLVSRSQQIMPHTSDLDATASIAVRLASTGAINTFVVPWLKSGIPITSQGPLPSPRRGNGQIFLTPNGQGIGQLTGQSAFGPLVFSVGNTVAADNTLPGYMEPLRSLLNASVPKDYYSVLGFGARSPVFAMPAGFVQRLGTQPVHFFFSGTYVAPNGLRIGFIRIPSMSPPSVAIALQQLDQEIAFFNANTDALVIDVTRNPGGLVSFVEAISQRFIPTPFHIIGFEIRATGAWLFSFASALNNALATGAPPEIVDNLRNNFNAVLDAYNENRGRSVPVSLNSTGSLTLGPVAGAYTHPLMVLVDEFSASGGDMFPAIIQDNNRGPLFGMRTMGAGGSVVAFNATAYTESIFRVTVSLMNRGRLIQTGEFPPAPYIENIGVRPDIPFDYMTRANLMTAGAPFVQAFTQAIMTHAATSP
jgi:Peptidase family S41/PDZ domain